MLAFCLAATTVLVGSSGANAADAAAPSASMAFTSRLLASAPVPSSAVRTKVLASPLSPASGLAVMKGYVDLHDDDVLAGPVDMSNFLGAHLKPGSTYNGPSTASGTGMVTTTSYTMAIPFANRHVSLEELVYTTARATNGAEELRVDAVVQWAPIRTVVMPTKGRVKVTLFRRISLSSSSSDPITVTLRSAKARRLRAVIESLSNTYGGLCMEDPTLFTISASPLTGGSPTWKAVARECPNVLEVTSGSTRVMLSGGSCTLGEFVTTLFPALANNETVTALRSCIPA